MEEVEKIAETVLKKINNVVLGYDSDIQEMFKTLDKIVDSACSNISTLQKTKKKPKRRICDSDSEDSLVSEKGAPAVEPQVPVEALNLAKTFSEELVPRTSSRPTRAAKLKIESGLKEQSLRVKLRRPSASDQAVNSAQQKIKEERKSAEAEADARAKTTSQNPEKLDSTKRKSSETINPDKQTDEEPSKKLDESLVILNNNEQQTVVIISDEEAGKMPPPAIIPKKKTLKKKTDNAEKRSDAPKIKNEKESLGGKTDKADSIEPVKQIEAEIEKIKEEKLSDVRKSGSSEGEKAPPKKRGKKKKHRPIKEEILVEEDETENESDVNSQAESVTQARPSTRSEKRKNTSFESVYEDAVSESGNTNKVHAELLPRVSTKTIDENREKVNDATFLSAVDAPVSNITSKDANVPFHQQKDTAPKSKALKNPPTEEKQCNDQTFVTSDDPQTTFIMNSNDKHKMQTMDSNDATFNVNAPEGARGLDEVRNGDILENSIFTEDESIEEPPPLPKSKMPLRGKKEIFNPCIQSPVKKKVDAFEKYASTLNRSPPPERPKRLNSKQKTTKENKEPQSYISSTSKVTPNIGRNISRLLTPTQQNNITPNVFSNIKTPSSTSKISNLPKPTKASGVGKTASLSRESSSEDVKKTRLQLKQLEEKKKKREQKQQMASQLREAKEKERTDKLKKMMEEREARRKAVEIEQKRQLDEINRNLKLQEERREAQKRAEKQKLLEMAEAAKKEREIMDAIKMQKAKEKLMNERKLLEQKKLIMKKNAYNFNMLNSDDSTDDEGKSSSKRPTPPAWSKSSARQLLVERQSHLPSKIIDSFFSVKAMTPDLRQIFPTLDSRYLKRNSSVFWKTPPRYSQLPKY